LVGHLGEMLAASRVGAALDPAAVPLYDGARELARAGIASTLLPENLALATLLQGEIDPALRVLLFDPQTSGPLLAGLPVQQAETCVAALRSAGARHAAIIGRVGDAVASAHEVRIAAGEAQ
jgi:selenide,water dikinase